MINLELHCWRCFKLDPFAIVIGDVQVKLCKGCSYEVKRIQDWFHAVGVKLTPLDSPLVDEGDVKGEKKASPGSTNPLVPDKDLK
jgi:hypothetical protein